MAMEYGQQAFAAMRAAEAARAHEARMNDEGTEVASGGAAPDTDAALKEQEKMLAERYQAGPDAFAGAPESGDEEEMDLEGADDDDSEGHIAKIAKEDDMELHGIAKSSEDAHDDGVMA